MCFLSIFPFAGFVIMVLLILLKVFSLKKQGVSVKAEGTKPQAAKGMLYAIFGLVLLLWLTAMAGQTFKLRIHFIPALLTDNIFHSQALKLAGTVVVALSVLLMLITLLHFKTSLRFGMDRSNPGKLITTGVFSFSRNPFFLSLNLYFIGQALVLQGILFIFLAIMAVAGIHIFILKEEKFMVSSYGEEYTAYKKRVGRYFGRYPLQ